MAQGCLVVNKEFAENHPKELSKFLDDYKASVEFIKSGSDEAISAIVTAGILPKEAIAKKALPNCNICFIEGKDMKDAMSVFYEKLFAADNKSILAIPDDSFYYSR
jgi:NitT/TauT family transport system substrate-binding protein